MFIFACLVAIDPALLKLGEEAAIRLLIASEPLILLLVAAVVTASRNAQKRQYAKQDKEREAQHDFRERRDRNQGKGEVLVSGEVRVMPEEGVGGRKNGKEQHEERRRDTSSGALRQLRESDSDESAANEHKGAL
jgi:hypothetical protein